MKKRRKSPEEYEQNRKRKIQINIRVTEEEAKKIDENAASCGLKRTEYMIRQAINGEIKFEEHEDLYALANEVNRVGININQAVRRMNEMGMVYEEDAKIVRDSLEEIKKQIIKQFDY